MKDKLSVKILFAAIVLAFTSCQKSETVNADISPSPNISPVQTSSPTPPASPNSSIRKIDFENFTYHYPILPGEKFTLENGEKQKTEDEDGALLGKIEYGDVTGDGQEEALIRIRPLTGGNCQCEMVYVYAAESDRPKLLWSFDTWDKAQGGLKKLSAENGNLIVETFGDNKFENDEWEFKFPKKTAGYCCPTAFTRIRFKWSGEKFIAAGKPELFDYDWKKEMNKR